MEKLIKEGLSFDDVLVIPRASEILPHEVNTSSRLAKDIVLSIPIISAAMDTVTESRLAIALAQEGGIGIIHRNLPPKAQAKEVDCVKRYESGMIVDPITLDPDESISKALEQMSIYKISGLPVVKEGKLVGILTNRDLRFLKDTNKKVSEIMTSKNLITAPVGTTLDDAEKILHEHRIEKLPVVDGNYHLKGLITVKDIEKKKKFPNAAKDDLGRLRVGAAIGVSSNTLERVELLVKAGIDLVAVDSAHGHSKGVIKTLQMVKNAYPDLPVMAGNVATTEGAEALIKAGADAIKVGMGPGSICTTRVVAGIGIPQVTAIYDCAQAAAKYDIPIISDGGIRFSGDITKAVAAGAYTVMIGALFAGTEEAPGETIILEGRTYKVYRAMGSIGAMAKGSRDRYGQQSVTDSKKLVPEGIEGRVPYKGSISAYIYQLVGGLRAGMGYCGVKTVGELRKNVNFVKISPAGLRESHPHDVTITKEAPNYRLD